MFWGKSFMKILMLSDFYPPVITGGGRHVEALSVALKRRGHDVAVCTVGSNSLRASGHSVEKGIRVFRMKGLWQKMPFLFEDSKRRWHPPVQDPMLTREITKIIKKETPDVVHAHGWILSSYLPLDKKFAIPLVLTLHGYGLICPKKNLMRGSELCACSARCIGCGSKQYGFIKSFFANLGVKLTKKKIESIDMFIAVSSFVKEVHLKRLNINENRIVVIPNFYDSNQDYFDQFRSLESQALPEDFILFVGVLAPFKGVDTLIKAYERMDTKTNLVVIGVKHPCYNYVRKKGVTIIENASRRTVLTAYSNCRLVVSPSIWPEPFGLVALEAMSFSKPIVASRVGGLQEVVVDGVTGILVPPGDPGKLAESVTRMLQNPDMCQKMGNLGYKRLITSFSTGQVVPKIENIYESIIK